MGRFGEIPAGSPIVIARAHYRNPLPPYPPTAELRGLPSQIDTATPFGVRYTKGSSHHDDALCERERAYWWVALQED